MSTLASATTPAASPDPVTSDGVDPASGEAAQAEETRNRILSEAEGLFRTYGYGKTTIADIARASGMSAGNVYRFFASKADLMGQIAERWLYSLDAEAAAIAHGDGPAEQRLYDFVRHLHGLSRDRHIHDRKVDELCSLVIREHWPAVENHVQRIRRAIAHILDDGVARREFAVANVDQAAGLICTALMKFNHPELIAQFLHEDMEEEAMAMCRLLVRGLRAG